MITGTHYFFGYSPLNFWSNLTKEKIDVGFNDLKSMGVKELYLLVPLGEFVDDRPCELSITNYCHESILYIFEKCSYYGIKLRLRLCYLWESVSFGRSTYNRIVNIFTDDGFFRTFDFLCGYLVNLATQNNISIYPFLTWEDFYWPIFMHWRSMSEEDRKNLSVLSGYRDYIKKLTKKEVDNIPKIGESDSFLFARFVDDVIFTNLMSKLVDYSDLAGFEYRVDADHICDMIIDGDSFAQYYHWKTNHLPGVIRYAYFHQHHGGPVEKILTPTQAADQLRWIHRKMCPMFRHKELPLIIDQFNFADNTEESWTKINLKETNDFLEIVNQYCQANGLILSLWSSIDWTRDIVCNGSFANGSLCWISSDNDGVVFHKNGAIVKQASTISQKFNLSLNHNEAFIFFMKFKVLTEIANITIVYSDSVKNIESCTGNCEIKINFERFNASEIFIKVDLGEVLIEVVSVFDKIYSQGGRNVESEAPTYFSKLFPVFLCETQ